MISNERLAEIKARNAARTQGKWVYDAAEVRSSTVVVVDAEDGVQSEEDGVFIAHASEDIPEMLAEVERIREIKSELMF